MNGFSIGNIFVVLIGVILFHSSSYAEATGSSEIENSQGINIAIGKKYTMTPAPNYWHCNDNDDSIQLTDGKIHHDVSSLLWIQKGTVGWAGIPYAQITVDLGKVEPLEKVALYSAFDGKDNVMWPITIPVFVSEDGKHYSEVTNLVGENWKDKGLPPEYAPFEGRYHRLHCYKSQAIKTKGRFVSFILYGQGLSYLFCDEIEIYRGTDEFLKQPVGGKYIGSLEAYRMLRPYLVHDINAVRKNASVLDESQKQIIEKQLMEADLLLPEMNVDDFHIPNHRAIVPLNEIHRKILSANALVMRMRNAPELMVWHSHRWAPLDATEIPENIDQSPGELSVKMMNNEYRAETLNLTNTTEKDLTVEISFKNLPGGKAPEYIQLHNVEFVATSRGNMIADALPLAPKKKDGFLTTIPSGMTRQIWIALHPEEIAPGQYSGTLSLSGKNNISFDIPFVLTIAPVSFPKNPRLLLGMFDYTDKPFGFKCITEKNAALAKDDMKKHFVRTPWGHCVPYPSINDFDKDGYLIKTLNTDSFDSWIKMWPDAGLYMIYLTNALPEFVKNDIPGDEKFNRKIAQWSAAFAKHLTESGTAPEKVVLHLFDEPHNQEQYKLNTLWAKAIKAGYPFSLYDNPGNLAVKTDGLQKLIQTEDIISINMMDNGQALEDTLRNIHEMSGGEYKQLMLHNCFGHARMFDPYYYHLLQAWYCWRNNATGTAYWNYWNYYRNPECSAWNEIHPDAQTTSFGVVYTDKDSVTTGKHWEAVREGIEDYEYLAMLDDCIKQAKKTGKDSALIAEAENILKTLPGKVAGKYDKNAIGWDFKKNRDMADNARNKIFDIIVKLIE